MTRSHRWMPRFGAGARRKQLNEYLCVQQRLTRSAGDSPAEVKARASQLGWQGGGKPMT